MKKLLSLALTLWSFVSIAQQTTTKIAELNPAPGKLGSKYYVYYERDWNRFPATTTGLNSLTLAIARGDLQLRVTTTGCIIPAGTKPPASPPTCSNPSGLPILSANTGLLSRYTYTSANGGTLQIRASGASSAQLKIETQNGQALTLSNAQNPTIPYNTFVGYGPSGESSYPYDWTFWGVPAVPIRISMQTGGSADVVAFTPAVGTNVPLTGPTGTTVTQPNTNTTTTPGSGTGVADGDFVAGAFDFADLPSASIPSDFRPSLETDKIKVTLDLREGTKPNNGLAGGIRYLWDKASGNNTISMPVFQPGSGNDYGFPLYTTDDGRGINECLYRLSPKPWNIGGFSLGIGDNVNESGDVSEHPSRLISYGNDGTTMFTAIEPNQWDGDGLRTGDVFKKWIRVNGNEMRVWYESKFNRTSATGADERQESKFQEAPCDYLNGNYSTIYFYDGDTPYQNASPRSFRLDDNSGMSPGATFMTENWMAGCDPATGRCQGIITETPAGQMGQFQSKGSYNAEGSLLSSTYIASYPFTMLDYNIKWRHSVIFVIGTLAEIRAKAYQYTSWKRTLEFKFNKSGRQGWGGRWFNDAGYKESRSTWGPITWTSNEGEIVTPAVALDGSIKKMYMRYRYVSSSRQNVNMIARWTRARQAAGYSNGTSLWDQRFPEGPAVGDDYAKTFSLIADGQWHVGELDFSDRAQWTKIITQVRFTNDGASAVGESLELDWISGSVNGPTN